MQEVARTASNEHPHAIEPVSMGGARVVKVMRKRNARSEHHEIEAARARNASKIAHLFQMLRTKAA
jgi:hypothetical protein